MRRTWALLVACLALLLAACGGDGGTETGAGEATTTSAAAATGGADGTEAGETGEGTDEAAGDVPQRIVSLSPTATEVLFAIGAGDQVVAVDSLSDHPAGAPITDLSAYEPNLEAIASYDPDLVVFAGYDPGDLVSGLEAIGVPVVSHGPAANLEEAYGQIEELGQITGHADAAAEVVADVRRRIEAAVASVPAGTGEATTVYHEVDDTFYSAASSSFTGELYTLLGLENIADKADDGSGYPQLNPEYIIEADPDLIVITDEVGYTPAEVAARPGWTAITAVANGDILQVDADLPSRWGPRVADYVELIAARVAEMQAA